MFLRYTLFSCIIAQTLGQLTVLPDGLFVTKTLDVHSVNTEYEVLIVIQPPVWPAEVDETIHHLRHQVDTLAGQGSLSASDVTRNIPIPCGR